MMDRNNLYVCGNQFVLDCEYADYEDFLDIHFGHDETTAELDVTL